ncbi:MAG: hypothetical protein ACLPYB_10405 [Desulfobaccales bacterium]
MAFRIQAKNRFIEVDTQEEFRSALMVLDDLDEKLGKPEKPTAQVSSEKPLAPCTPPPHRLIRFTKEQILANLYKNIKAEPRGGMLKVIGALYSTPEMFAPGKLMADLNLANSALGGILGAISKRAAKFGLKPEDVLLREETNQGIRYQLSPDMREVVRSESEKESTM